MNQKFYRIKILKQFLTETANVRSTLIDELINQGTNDTVVNRRFLMLQHLSQFEAQIIQKISEFDSDDSADYTLNNINVERVVNRSA